MAQNRPRRRTPGQTPNMASTTRGQAPILFFCPPQPASPPAAPCPPTWSSNPLQIDRVHHKAIYSRSMKYPCHVTSPNTPTSDDGSLNQRSPSPIPPTPGAPKIAPLDDSDIEDEDKNLVGLDRGYLRLGGRRLRYIPSPPATPPPCEQNEHEEAYDSASSKMNSQLEFAIQYIRAQAQMGSHPRAPPSQDREDSSETDGDQDVDSEHKVYFKTSRSSCLDRRLSRHCMK